MQSSFPLFPFVLHVEKMDLDGWMDVDFDFVGPRPSVSGLPGFHYLPD